MSATENYLAAQSALQASDTAAGVKAAELLQSKECVTLITDLEALLVETMPGSLVEQQLVALIKLMSSITTTNAKPPVPAFVAPSPLAA